MHLEAKFQQLLAEVGGGGNQSIGGNGGGTNGIQPPTTTQFSGRIAGRRRNADWTEEFRKLAYQLLQDLVAVAKLLLIQQAEEAGGWYGGGTGASSTGGGGGSGRVNPAAGLTNGITVAQGQAGFVANPGAGGHGFARITFIATESSSMEMPEESESEANAGDGLEEVGLEEEQEAGEVLDPGQTENNTENNTEGNEEEHLEGYENDANIVEERRRRWLTCYIGKCKSFYILMH